MVDKKSRTIGRSFRINERCLNVLNEESKKEGISTNALLNNVLQDYSIFHRHFKRYGGIILTQKTFSAIMEACPKEDLREIAKKGGSMNAKDFFSVINAKFQS